MLCPVNLAHLPRIHDKGPKDYKVLENHFFLLEVEIVVKMVQSQGQSSFWKGKDNLWKGIHG